LDKEKEFLRKKSLTETTPEFLCDENPGLLSSFGNFGLQTSQITQKIDITRFTSEKN